MITIDVFNKDYDFLSPNYEFVFYANGVQKTFLTIQHAYQYHKTFDGEFRDIILETHNPQDVYTLGQKSVRRDDWYGVKYFVMKSLLRQRFNDITLRQRLINTGNSFIVMHNDISPYWGIVEGVGKNTYGKLIMDLRQDFLKTY